MAQIPSMNLSPEATPWGREMQRRVVEQEQQITRLRQETENSLRAVNGAMTNMGFQSYAVTGNFGLVVSLAAPTITSAIGQNINITITERRLVSVTCTTNYVYAKNTGGLSTGFGSLGVSVDGQWNYGDISFGSSATTTWQGASVTAVISMVLEPGVHVIGCSAELHVGDAVSSPTGQARLNDEYILQVQVHGRA